MRTSLSLTAVLWLGVSSAVFAADLTVDTNGTTPYTTIGQAMAAASPGDRILVMPGSYPAFQFDKGVHVHGLGERPADVAVARVDYHVGNPTVGYDSTLSNLTLAAKAGSGYLALSGNELPPGVLVVEGVHIVGGVFLGGGGEGFALQMTNCLVEPFAGQGFFDAAMHAGGPGSSVELVDSRIVGWDATLEHPAGSALRLVGGTRARLSDVRLSGGHGLSADPSREPGGHAVIDGFWPLPVELRVDGDSSLLGGDAAGLGAGGHAVDVNGSVELGDAVVQGGAGMPAGAAWADAQPVTLPFDLHLELTPKLRDAADTGRLVSGTLLELDLSTPGPSAIALSFGLDLAPPAAPLFVLSPTTLLLAPGEHVALFVPTSPFAHDLHGVMLYAQGLARDPANGLLHLGNSVAMRVDLLETLP